MLPVPATFTKRKTLRQLRSNVFDVFLSRTRPINLVILLLLFISLLFNTYIYSTVRIYHDKICISSGLFQTITREDTIRGLKHLIVVPGHAIWKGGDPQSRLDEDQWILEPYQKSGGRVATFFAHIQQG